MRRKKLIESLSAAENSCCPHHYMERFAFERRSVADEALRLGVAETTLREWLWKYRAGLLQRCGAPPTPATGPQSPAGD